MQHARTELCSDQAAFQSDLVHMPCVYTIQIHDPKTHTHTLACNVVQVTIQHPVFPNCFLFFAFLTSPKDLCKP